MGILQQTQPVRGPSLTRQEIPCSPHAPAHPCVCKPMADIWDMGPGHTARLSLRVVTSGREEAGTNRWGQEVGKTCMQHRDIAFINFQLSTSPRVRWGFQPSPAQEAALGLSCFCCFCCRRGGSAVQNTRSKAPMRFLGLWWAVQSPRCQCTRWEHDVKCGSMCGHLFLPQDFSPNPLSAASPSPTDSLAVSSPPVTPRLTPHITAVLRCLLGRCMALVSKWCPEGTEVSNKTAERPDSPSSQGWGPWRWPQQGGHFSGNGQPLEHGCCGTGAKQEKTLSASSLAAGWTASCRLQRPSRRIFELKTWVLGN